MKTFTGFIIASLMCAMAGPLGTGCSTLKHAEEGVQESRNGPSVPPGVPDSSGREFTLVASAKSGGSISPAGATKVTAGASQTYIATADAGFEIADVLVDGRSAGTFAYLYRDDSSSYTFTNVKRNHVILVSFKVLKVDIATYDE